MRVIRYGTSARTPGRARGAGALVAVAGLALMASLAGMGAAAASAGRPAARVGPANDNTASMNVLRTGWDRHEPNLGPAAVSSPQFGEVFSTAVKGQVYAQPLVVGSVVIVATENDWVYGLNAATGAIEWSKSLGTPWPIPDCTDLTPNIGITSAPVYDPSTGSVYVAAQVVVGSQVLWKMYGLNAKTGAITLTRKISGSPSNDPDITFTPADEGQRAGLLLLHGWVYASFASHCDHAPWAGFIAGVNVAGTKATTLWTDEAGVTDDMAGIWQGGGGLMSDGPGRIIVTSGNGVSPAPGPGNAPPGQLAESVIQLAQQPGGTLAAQDFFSPANAPSLDAGDLDFGSGGPVGFPVGTTVYPHMLIQAGKAGNLFVLNRDALGGREQGPGGTDADLFQSQHYSGLWGHPALFEASTTPIPPASSGLPDYVYYVGKNDLLRAFQLSTSAAGAPLLTDVANSSFTFGYTSGAPVVTSNGTSASSAVVWEVESSSSLGPGAFLTAFDAMPQPASGGGLQLKEISDELIGTASKFTIPATGNGMVYVGTRDGNVLGFGVTPAPALRGSITAAFGRTAVGTATTRTATVTATRTVIVTGVGSTALSTPDPFTTGPVTETVQGHGRPVAVSFPVTLHRGDRLRTPVRFAPAAPGGASGVLSFTTAGRDVPVSVPLIADATRTGLYATITRPSLELSLNDGTQTGPVPVGVSVSATTTIVNGGITPQRITRVSAPGPFTYQALPRPGTMLRPGQSVIVQVTYSPTHVAPATATLVIDGSSGTAAVVTLSSASQAPVSKLTGPGRIGFGQVRVGHTVTRFIHLVNDGNTAATVVQTALSKPFRAPDKVAAGLPVNGGYDLDIPVTFTPARAGRVTGSYTLSWTDWFGSHVLTVHLTVTGVG